MKPQIKTPAQLEQDKMSNDLSEIHVAMDTASKLLSYLMNEHFVSDKVPKNFDYDYETIQTKLQAVFEFQYQACVRMDLITGDESELSQAFRRNMEELLKCPG